MFSTGTTSAQRTRRGERRQTARGHRRGGWRRAAVRSDLRHDVVGPPPVKRGLTGGDAIALVLRFTSMSRRPQPPVVKVGLALPDPPYSYRGFAVPSLAGGSNAAMSVPINLSAGSRSAVTAAVA